MGLTHLLFKCGSEISLPLFSYCGIPFMQLLALCNTPMQLAQVEILTEEEQGDTYVEDCLVTFGRKQRPVFISTDFQSVFLQTVNDGWACKKGLKLLTPSKTLSLCLTGVLWLSPPLTLQEVKTSFFPLKLGIHCAISAHF